MFLRFCSAPSGRRRLTPGLIRLFFHVDLPRFRFGLRTLCAPLCRCSTPFLHYTIHTLQLCGVLINDSCTYIHICMPHLSRERLSTIKRRAAIFCGRVRTCTTNVERGSRHSRRRSGARAFCLASDNGRTRCRGRGQEENREISTFTVSVSFLQRRTNERCTSVKRTYQKICILHYRLYNIVESISLCS